MFRYLKLLISDIRFWCQECKLRRMENKEWEHIDDEEWCHPMESYELYQTMKRNRTERKRLHAEERAGIQ